MFSLVGWSLGSLFHLGKQVAMMARYSMLIGMQGAGMTNGLYLPRGAVVVIMLQYGIVMPPSSVH